MRQFMHSFVGHTPPPEVLAALSAGQISSFCLFRDKNIGAPAQVRELCHQLSAAALSGGHLPPLIGIDQEGGQLMAIHEGVTELPGNMALGATRSPELARLAGQVIGRELRAMGINMNFAPSLDVNLNPANPVIGVRSFGDDPALVAELGLAFMAGMEAQGVMATPKHFPGHGDTGHDTHHGEARLDHSRARLDSVELAPFRAAIQGGAGALMTAHIIAAALDPQHPATLSRAILYELLRQDWAYEGLIITDAMDMQAVAQYGPKASITAALAAGADLILLGHLPDQLGLNDHFRPQALPAALARIESAQKRWAPSADDPSLDVLACPEHQEIAQRIAESSITLVKNEGGQIPLRLEPGCKVAVITPQAQNLTPADTSGEVKIALGALVTARHPGPVIALELAAGGGNLGEVIEAASAADVVIIGTINAYQDAQQVALVQELTRRGKNPLVVALRIPYDVLCFPEVQTYLCTYSIRKPSMEAVVKVLWGDIIAKGVLPCNLEGG